MDSLKDLKTVPITSDFMAYHRKFMDSLHLRMLKEYLSKDTLGRITVNQKGKV